MRLNCPFLPHFYFIVLLCLLFQSLASFSDDRRLRTERKTNRTSTGRERGGTNRGGFYQGTGDFGICERHGEKGRF